MAAYFARRFLLLIPTFIGITFLVFSITQFVPGGPIDQMILNMQASATEGGVGGSGSSVEIPPESLAALKEHFNLDKPFFVAYGHWLWDLVQLDLGKSYKYNTPVIEVITSRFPISIYFGLLGFFLAYLICIPLGVLKAVRHGSRLDITSSMIVFAGYSIPGWALGGGCCWCCLVGAVSWIGSPWVDSAPKAGRTFPSGKKSLTSCTTRSCRSWLTWLVPSPP